MKVRIAIAANAAGKWASAGLGHAPDRQMSDEEMTRLASADFTTDDGEIACVIVEVEAVLPTPTRVSPDSGGTQG